MTTDNVVTYPVYDFKHNSGRAKSCGKCLQLRQSIAKRETSNNDGKEHCDYITSRQLTGKDTRGTIPVGKTSEVKVYITEQREED